MTGCSIDISGHVTLIESVLLKVGVVKFIQVSVAYCAYCTLYKYCNVIGIHVIIVYGAYCTCTVMLLVYTCTCTHSDTIVT